MLNKVLKNTLTKAPVQTTVMNTARAMSVIRSSRKQPTTEELAQATLMCEYASHGNIKGLQAAKAKGISLDVSDYDFRTPLHLAAAVGNDEVVKWLVENGATLQVDRFGGLAVHDALRNNHDSIAEYLQDHRIQSDVKFESDRAEQMDQVFQLIVKEEGLFSFSLIANEVDYFYNHLGLNYSYFELFTPSQIAKHIHSLIAAKKVADIGGLGENIKLGMTKEDAAFYLCTAPSQDEVRHDVEANVAKISTDKSISVSYMKSSGDVKQNGTQKLQLINVQQNNYENPKNIDSDDILLTSTSDFIKNKSKSVMAEYGKAIRDVMRNPHPHISYVDTSNDGQAASRIMFGVKSGRAKGVNHQTRLFQVIDLCEAQGINVSKGYQHTFSNGVTCYAVHAQGGIKPEVFSEVKKTANLILTMPDNMFLNPELKSGQLSPQEAFYLFSATRFAFYFMYQWNEDFENLYKHLSDDAIQQRKLVNLKMGLDSENVKLDAIKRTLSRYPDITDMLYKDFNGRMNNGAGVTGITTTIDNKVTDAIDKQLLQTFRIFNKSVLKTNFFKEDIGAIGYRLDPSVFLGSQKLPEVPFGIFLLIGRDFNGFHVRFRDIARGGIRLIKSTQDNYENNKATQFQENYGLAYTQKLKNKDITESGSKGTILLDLGKNHQGDYAFMQYIDTLLDLMLVADGVSSIYDAPEYLFFGPDENTAPLMDPACLFTKKKGYEQWKSITTGKSGHLGGIPHDTYGMTTRSVRQFAIGVQRKLGHEQSEMTKFVTGGPDGDLGSNELLMGVEKVIGIVDGSGTLFDPNGLDRNSLLELVKTRSMVDHYDGPFSEGGFFVPVGATDVTLPDGTKVASGMKLRNEFHLNPMVKADYFVPCGGRPESVNLENVHKMFDENGTLRFPHIIEGANLFITEPARHVLEDAGCILFKDASTNKGGVTSSSLEVLAALSFDDDNFKKDMTSDEDGRFSDFYKIYVDEIIERVEANAKNEFEIIWKQGVDTGRRRSELTIELSEAMNDLFDVILASSLYEKESVRKNVLLAYFPKTLVERIGYDALCDRIPPTFLKAAFAKYLAASYYYEKGTDSNVYEFYEYVNQFDK